MYRWNKNIVAFLVGIFICCSTAFAAEPEAGVQILKYDRPADAATMPANFRTAQSPYGETLPDGSVPSRAGLEKLRMSGSSFFAKSECREMLKQIPADKKDIIVLDLRNESHGYINDNGVSWYSRYKTFNKGLDAENVDKREKALLKGVLGKTVPIATLAGDKSVSSVTQVRVDSVMTEKEFIESLGLKYYRIPVMDYTAPTNENIDQFLRFYKKLPKNAWIHAHCEAGEGRTTVFLSLLDMLQNADKLSYDEIMTREHFLGGQDVRTSAATAKDAYKKENYPKRALFTQHFYDYVQANPTLRMSWSEWAAAQHYE